MKEVLDRVAAELAALQSRCVSAEALVGRIATTTDNPDDMAGLQDLDRITQVVTGLCDFVTALQDSGVTVTQGAESLQELTDSIRPMDLAQRLRGQYEEETEKAVATADVDLF